MTESIRGIFYRYAKQLIPKDICILSLLSILSGSCSDVVKGNHQGNNTITIDTLLSKDNNIINNTEDISKQIDTPQKIRNDTIIANKDSISIVNNEINFVNTMNKVLDEGTRGLRHYYKTNNIHIEIVCHKREFDEQLQLLKKEKTKSIISLHHFGLAYDISIFINDKYQEGKRRNSKGQFGTQPYQIVGFFAQQEGLFRGWDKDSGHIALTETVSNLIEIHPEYKNNDIIKKTITYLTQQQEIDIKYKKLFEKLGIPTEQYTRFINTEIPWGYLPSINPYQ